MTFFVTSEPIGDGGNLGAMAGAAQAVHSDRIGHGSQSWNSSHATTDCSQADFASWNGAGLFYCFAID